MEIHAVEIYSDATNRAVLRHPGRRYAGVLIQRDSLEGMIRICRGAETLAYELQSLADHYDAVTEGYLPPDERDHPYGTEWDGGLGAER